VTTFNATELISPLKNWEKAGLRNSFTHTMQKAGEEKLDHTKD
jgi:hypothetical protein